MNLQPSVRSAVLESLHGILSPERDVREASEEKLKALEVTEDYGLVLTEIAADSQESSSLKQLAAVLLKKYVDVHWCEHSEKFSLPEVPPNVKTAIRSIIPRGLTEADSRVRATVAYVISSIAHWDWPEEWPQLFDLLMQALSSSDNDAVHGSMRVLTEFTREITDTQMSQIAPVLFPELYRIFVTTGQFSNRCRGRAVVIFTTCTDVIIEIAQLDKSLIKQLLVPILPKFIEAFLEALQSKNAAVTDIGIKTEVMKSLIVLVRNVPNHMSKYFSNLVTCVWSCLVDTSVSYIKNNVQEDPDDVDDDICDSEGEVLGPEALIYSVFEFITVLVDTSKYHSIIKGNVQQLLYYITLYAQMTTEQESCWSQSPNQFVEDEDDDSFSFSVRISSLELFQSLIAEFEEVALPALAENIQTHLTQAEAARKAGNPSWWKTVESLLMLLGHVRLMFADAVKEGKVQFNMEEFTHNVLFNYLHNSGSPFLAGRCLWLASRLSHCLEPATNQRFVEATVNGLAANQPPCIRISAVRATFHFCENLPGKSQLETLNPALGPVLDGALSVAQSYGTEVMALCLDSMESLLKVNKEFTASVTEKSMPFFMAVFLKYSHDQHVIEITKDIITHLANARNDIVQLKMLPTLVSIIQQRQPDKLPSTLQPGSLEMVETLVRGGPEPISDQLMQVFPIIANLTVATDDSSIMQNGGECLRAYVSKSAQQVVGWRDDQGNTGLSIIGSVVSKLLDPKAPEFSAAYVGRLVSLLITKLGSTIGSDLDLILRAVLSKLQQTETLTITQELVLVFARLVISSVEALLDFLTMTPGPDGNPALNFVLTQWCSRQHQFFGSYETKVGAVALSKLLLHAINTNDTRLQNIYLKEEIVPMSSIIRTRSKAKAVGTQWADTPILIKIYKLLINELAHQLEDAQFRVSNICKAAGDASQLGSEEQDDEDDEEENDEDLLANLLDNEDMFDEDEEESDPDILADPIYHMNLRDYLIEYLKSLSQTQYYETFKSTHNNQEIIVLKQIGIQT